MAGSRLIEENSTVAIAERTDVKIALEIQHSKTPSPRQWDSARGVRARLTPLKATSEESFLSDTVHTAFTGLAYFDIREAGSYALELLWKDHDGKTQSCALRQRFEVACSKHGYVQQLHGTVCVKPCEGEYVPSGNECGVRFSSYGAWPTSLSPWSGLIAHF